MLSRRTRGKVPGGADKRARFSRARLPAAVALTAVVAAMAAGGGRVGAVHYVRQLAHGPAGPGRDGAGARPAGLAFPAIPAGHGPARRAVPRSGSHGRRARPVRRRQLGLADFLAGLASRRLSVPIVLLVVEGGGL